MPDPSSPLLDVRGLRISHAGSRGPGVILIPDLSFSISRGETLGLVGESGSGKTLSCLSVIRLLPSGIRQEAGSVGFFPAGKDPVSMEDIPDKDLQSIRGKHIGMIFQDPLDALNPVLTCGDQLKEVIERHFPGHEDSREASLNWLRRVKLENPDRMFESYPWQLSGGQLQRVMIALALAGEPELVIADEPTSSLDVLAQRSILDLLKSLREAQGCSFLFVSHDLGVIREMAQRVLVMRAGRKVEEAPVETLLRSPNQAYTRALIACRPYPHLKLSRLPVLSDFLKDDDASGEGKEGAVQVTGLLKSLLEPEEKEMRRLRSLYEEANPLLKAKGLCTDFPAKRGRKHRIEAVKKASFEIFPEEILGLVGPSGSGKSTLARTLLGLDKATGGKLMALGEDLLDHGPEQWRALRRDWQIIFQDPMNSLNPRMSVGNAILEPIRYHRLAGSREEARSKAVQLLEEVQLDGNFFNRYPGQLSGGEKQRVSIARALATSPRFMIWDEAVSALDVTVQAGLLNLLRRLNREKGLTCLLITHDLAVVASVCDRILVMEEGKIVEEGFARKVLDKPQHPCTQALLKALPADWDEVLPENPEN